MDLLWDCQLNTYCFARLPDVDIDYSLVDQSLQMNLYKVHNLPMLHPTLNVHVQYELEGTYLVIIMEGMFISLPTALDIKLCLITNGHLCMVNQALYPVERTN